MKTGAKALLFWFSFLGVLFWMTSCKSPKPIIVTEKVKETITETLHDTVFQTEKDSSMYRALLDCQDGKVVIKEVIKAKPGDHLNAPEVTINNNTLSADCYAEAQRLFAQWKSTVKATVIEKPVPVYIEKELTWYQKLQMWCGGIFLLLLLGAAIWGIIKLKKLLS
ncbi:hypothetical protein [Flavobacterium beibuense]|uniref:hypothetical protein n=1 Tax=Flavobacterium beibuense TaxID=657326 RepID=UPI003A9301F5